MLNSLVLFDDENQIEEITLLKNWELASDFNLAGFAIKDEIVNKRQEIDLSEIDLVIVLIGESTKFLGSRFKTVTQKILQSDVSILCLNTNGFIGLEENICPKILADAGCIHMPFTKKDLQLSLSYIKPNGRLKNKTGSFHFKNYTPDPLAE